MLIPRNDFNTYVDENEDDDDCKQIETMHAGEDEC